MESNTHLIKHSPLNRTYAVILSKREQERINYSGNLEKQCMKDIRQLTVVEFLKLIQNKIRSNGIRLNLNKHKIEEYRTLVMSKNIDVSELILRLQIENDEISDENSDLVKLHHKIHSLNDEFSDGTQFDEAPKNYDSASEMSPVSPEECVNRILENRMEINEDNPHLSDNNTVEMIYKALIENERYEECALLMKIKERGK
jgi:hypothetical protein